MTTTLTKTRLLRRIATATVITTHLILASYAPPPWNFITTIALTILTATYTYLIGQDHGYTKARTLQQRLTNQPTTPLQSPHEQHHH